MPIPAHKIRMGMHPQLHKGGSKEPLLIRDQPQVWSNLCNIPILFINGMEYTLHYTLFMQIWTYYSNWLQLQIIAEDSGRLHWYCMCLKVWTTSVYYCLLHSALQLYKGNAVTAKVVEINFVYPVIDTNQQN